MWSKHDFFKYIPDLFITNNYPYLVKVPDARLGRPLDNYPRESVNEYYFIKINDDRSYRLNIIENEFNKDMFTITHYTFRNNMFIVYKQKYMLRIINNILDYHPMIQNQEIYDKFFDNNITVKKLISLFKEFYNDLLNKYDSFGYLRRMLEQTTYEYRNYITAIPFVPRDIYDAKQQLFLPRDHYHTGTLYFMISLPNYPEYHLSIFENEFNDKKFHITKLNDKSQHITFAWNDNKNLTIHDQQSKNVYDTHFQNEQDKMIISNLISIFMHLLETVYKYKAETMSNLIGGNNKYVHKYHKYKTKYLSLKNNNNQ